LTTHSARGNNSDTVRQGNLSTVLSLVHRAGPLARAELTRRTGLNRSTIADLVADLGQRGLAVESEPSASNRVGRPSPLVSAAADVVAVAINPEIDAVTVGVVGLGGHVHQVVRHPLDTIPSAREAVTIAKAVLARLSPVLAKASRVVGVGVAVPGLVRRLDGVVRLAPHLGWVDEPFAAQLSVALDLPVQVANDAGLGANAEWIFGSGRGARDLVYLNGGASGIGAGVITGGVALNGVSGYAGELGHTLVNSAGSLCHCGASGCLETEVSQSELLRVLGLDSADADELERALIADATRPAVAAEVERQLGFLAVAVRNATNVFNPERIVLGGFLEALIAAAPGRLDALVTERALSASAESLSIVRAQLGSTLLMVGAAELAFSPLLADPAGS
jgi:predicted NBD/HSP70 family sugar kinase